MDYATGKMFEEKLDEINDKLDELLSRETPASLDEEEEEEEPVRQKKNKPTPQTPSRGEKPTPKFEEDADDDSWEEEQ